MIVAYRTQYIYTPDPYAIAPVRHEPERKGREHLCQLDALRETDATNMYGAAPWLVNAFDLNREDAKAILLYWMHSFGERHGEE